MSMDTAKKTACGIIDAMEFTPASEYEFRYDGLYFISGPMSGIDDWNKDAFDACRQRLCEVVDPNGIESPADGIPTEYEDEKPYAHYMLDTISYISDNYKNKQKTLVPILDALILLPNWETSYGAVMEAMVAHECGIDLVLWEADNEID